MVPATKKPMSDDEDGARLEVAEQLVGDLERQLTQIRDVIRQWTDAGQSLALSAAEAHAKNRGAGLGLGGILFGAKYRAIERRSATRSNARISQEAVNNRSKIAEGKRVAKEIETNIKKQLIDAKASVKALQGLARKATSVTRAILSSVSLLKKLKKAHDLGLLTDEEYDAKRRAAIESF